MSGPDVPRFRDALPQLSGGLYLADGGLETDLIFNHGVEIFEFAAHTLLSSAASRAALVRYFDGYLRLANDLDAGFILGTPTWKAHRHWAAQLGVNEDDLARANADSVRFVAEIRDRHAANRGPIVLNAVVGPRGDAYRLDATIEMDAAEDYFGQQLSWLAATSVDMVTAATFNQPAEASGLVKAARTARLPAVVSFTVETNGTLATGHSLEEAIETVDAATGGYPAYFMVNCAHPDHFAGLFRNAPWTRRVRGVRANASRRSHAQLDAAPALDAGDPHELAEQYRALAERMPWLNVFGGCCGTDLRHVTAIAHAVKTGTRQPIGGEGWRRGWDSSRVAASAEGASCAMPEDDPNRHRASVSE